MFLEGTLVNGQVVLDESPQLPDGTRVRVEIFPEATPPPRTHYDFFKDFIGSIPDLPEDFAENHDHYIHGTPKK